MYYTAAHNTSVWLSLFSMTNYHEFQNKKNRQLVGWNTSMEGSWFFLSSLKDHVLGAAWSREKPLLPVFKMQIKQ